MIVQDAHKADQAYNVIHSSKEFGENDQYVITTLYMYFLWNLL